MKKRKENYFFGLRTRLVLVVTVEMILCILLGFGIDELLQLLFGESWKMPLLLELLLVSLLIGILITGFLSHYFFLPIQKMRNAMEQVAQGDFTVKLDVRSGSKEIREVYSGFNMMVDGLRSTEVLQADFISGVSHEFKTPINAIEGYTTLLQGCDNLEDDQKIYVDKILYNTERLSKLAGDILFMSKIESQTIVTNQTSYDLDEQIRKVIVGLEPIWDRKEIEFDIELEDTVYYGNEIQMNHVWSNLISNAVKFSPQLGTVRIRLKNAKEQIIFTIEDTGPGIPEKAIPHIFDKFYQADSSHKEEGHGLGLSVVAKILELEKGSVTVENLAGGGCRFTVVLKGSEE
jgi:signal transduction histidine kinase